MLKPRNFEHISLYEKINFTDTFHITDLKLGRLFCIIWVTSSWSHALKADEVLWLGARELWQKKKSEVLSIKRIHHACSETQNTSRDQKKPLKTKGSPWGQPAWKHRPQIYNKKLNSANNLNDLKADSPQCLLVGALLANTLVAALWNLEKKKKRQIQPKHLTFRTVI